MRKVQQRWQNLANSESIPRKRPSLPNPNAAGKVDAANIQRVRMFWWIDPFVSLCSI